jgi:hypothetical protein
MEIIMARVFPMMFLAFLLLSASRGIVLGISFPGEADRAGGSTRIAISAIGGSPG